MITMHDLFIAQTPDRHKVLHGKIPPPTNPIGTLQIGNKLRRFFITTCGEIKEYSIPDYYEITDIYDTDGIPHATIIARYDPPLNVIIDLPLHRIPLEFTK